MSNALYGIVPAAFINAIATLIAADGTAAKVLLEPQAAAVATATSPLFYGGATAIDITAASTDAAAKDVILWHGQVVTTVGGSTGVASTTTGTITRATGSFITDGWKPGELVMVFNAPDQARQAGVDGVLGVVSAVTATTLTVNGTPFTAATITTGARICRMSYDLRAPVAANAGTNGTSATVNLLNNGNDGSVVRYERKLGANELLAVSVATAVSALPAYITVGAQVAKY